MAKESLALPELLAELPAEADYDTVLEVLMATERGRRFLGEFASRNRNADTAIVVGAIARVEAAVRGEPAPQTSTILSSAEPGEVAAAIERIEAELSASRNQSAAALAAIERIQDIAFVLHERPVEATLCDTLDEAIRQISDAFVSRDADRAADLLRALAGKLGVAAPMKSKASDGRADEPQLALVVAQSSETEDDAELFAVVSETIPQQETQLSSAVDQHEAPVETAAEISEAVSVTTDASQADAVQPPEDMFVHSVSSEFVEPAAEEPVGEVAAEAVEPVAPAYGSEPLTIHASSSDDILNELFSDGPVAETHSPPPQTPAHGVSLNEHSSGEARLPPQDHAATQIGSPHDDPDNLFVEPALAEAVTDIRAMAKAANAAPVSHSDAQPVSPRTAMPMSYPVLQPSGSDPLAAVRTLSDEELIALFS